MGIKYTTAQLMKTMSAADTIRAATVWPNLFLKFALIWLINRPVRRHAHKRRKNLPQYSSHIQANAKGPPLFSSSENVYSARARARL